MTKKIELDSGLLSILKKEAFNNFTVLELRGAYLAISGNKDLQKIEARRFVYRHILRLEKKGLLQRTYSKNTNKTSYVKTSLFDINLFCVKDQSLDKDVERNDDENNSLSKDLLKSLVNKLQNYKVELLTSIGETDEYKSLCLEYPQLKEQLQESYNSARENSQIIIGKVKALESFIEQQKQGVQA
tara:strand:+ start:663 stop:1220 length:558 start_codon:yes stop_codon:yes gene_type:complete